MLCTNQRCLCALPPEARYCPRCGASLYGSEVSAPARLPDARAWPNAKPAGGGFIVFEPSVRGALNIDAISDLVTYMLAVAGMGILVYAFLRFTVVGL